MFEHKIDSDAALRILRPEDAEELFGLVDSNRPHLREWLPWVDANASIEDSRQFIEAASRQHARNDGFHCAILLSDRIVGCVGYHSIQWPNRTTDLGYWIGRDAEGRGLVTRACRALIEHAFVELRLNRVSLCAAVENSRSRAVAERLGFRQEGVLREKEWLYDHFVDHALYTLLACEWSRESADPANAAGGTISSFTGRQRPVSRDDSNS